MDDWVKYTTLALRRYADFQGRSRRAEYWWFFLAMVCWSIVEQIVVATLRHIPLIGLLLALPAILVSLALLVPGLAVSFRRLHDTDRSAWWLLIGLIPLIGTILLIVWAASPGTAGSNRFGDDPIATDVAPEPAPIAS